MAYRLLVYLFICVFANDNKDLRYRYSIAKVVESLMVFEERICFHNMSIENMVCFKRGNENIVFQFEVTAVNNVAN